MNLQTIGLALGALFALVFLAGLCSEETDAPQ